MHPTRPAIFWQTQKAVRGSNPGAKIPRARALAETVRILIDTRDRYPYRFAGRDVATDRIALGAGDYAVVSGEMLTAVVERKTFENFVASLSDLTFQMQRLSEVLAAAVVVEGRYSDLFKLKHVPPPSSPMGSLDAGSLPRGLGRSLADARRFAEEWTYRFRVAALSDAKGGDPVAETR